MFDIDEKQLDKMIGVKIKSLRTEAKLSQDDLASKLGLLRTSITNIELGKQKLTLANLYRLSSLFSIEFSEILPDIQAVASKQLDTEELLKRTESIREKYRSQI